MPTYEYSCENCGRFEVFASIKAEALKTCPTCRNDIKMLFGNSGGFLFKGNGFYITDYRNPEYKKKVKEEAISNKPVGIQETISNKAIVNRRDA